MRPKRICENCRHHGKIGGEHYCRRFGAMDYEMGFIRAEKEMKVEGKPQCFKGLREWKN